MTTYEPGDRVLIRGEVIECIEGVGANVELFSKTDQYRAWVRPDLLCPKGSVVLDLDGQRLADFLRSAAKWHTSVDCAWVASVADQIETQTKPPRIDEPGWGAIVEAGLGPVKSAGHRTKLVRANSWDDDRWVREDGARYEWDELIDPIEIRKGGESDA